jgi:predicted DNA repair protein MutK
MKPFLRDRILVLYNASILMGGIFLAFEGLERLLG